MRREASIRVRAPGLLTTVQDLGRWGHQSDGVSVAGAMDPFAHRLANALVGNGRDAATLEVTLSGPELEFDDARWIAVAGAEFELMLDDEPLAPATPVRTRTGSTLRFGLRRSGARAYMAIEGGVDVPEVMGSRATHVPSAMGGWHGRAVQRGDCLPVGQRHSVLRMPPRASVPGGSAVEGPAIVRVMPGPQRDSFREDALEMLVSAPYVVAPESNRMGYRLVGPHLGHRAGADIISDATPIGSLQVPGSGQPVLLMADRQTTGGFAKLATVISADVPIAAQVAPGGTISFRVCTYREALAALVAREHALLALEPDVA